MRIKRLLCVCAALALLLSVPARAAEATDVPETLEIWEETPVDIPLTETPEDPEETPETPEIPPEVPDVPEVPDTPAPPDVSETPEVPGDLETEEDESSAPAEDEDLSEEDESPAAAEDEELPEEGEPLEEAGDEAEDGPEEEEPPVIQVAVPNTGRVVVNPYGLEVNMDGMISTDQIVSAPMPIVSYSNVPVAVVASVTGHTSPGSDAVFVSSQPRDNAKEIFLFAEFQPADEYGSAFWSGQYTGARNQLVVTAGGSPAAQVLELAAGDVVPSYGAFRLFGSASGSPERMWSAEDAIHVTLTFTFVPLT